MLFGVASSLLIGLSDFFGRRCSDTSGPLATVNVAYWAGATSTLFGALLLGHDLIGRDLLLGAASGVAIAVALWAVYTGFVAASAGVTAPVTAVVVAAVPVLLDIAKGDAPTGLVWVGIVVGLGSLVASSWSPDGNVGPGVAWGVVGGVVFAIGILITAETSEASGVWPVVSQRYVAGIVASGAALATGQALLPGRLDRPWAALSGVLGTAGIGALVVGTQRADTTLVIIAGSFFPAVTIALGAYFDDETLRWWQVVGLGGALVGVALISVA